MKRLLLITIVLVSLGLTNLSAQIHEIGVFVGGSNYVGDIGSTRYINPNKFAFGFLYKWNRSPRHAWRISYMQSTINANDAFASDNARIQRGLRFDNNLKEVSAGLEFNFFDFNLHDFSNKFTPYIYTGISYTNYDEKFFLNKISKKDINKGLFAIPMIVGIKTKFTQTLILGAEVGARYAFSDNLDGSNPKNENLKPLQFGNLSSRDWYFFSGFTLTYTFGEKPCYCKD